jgi:hypothetical protein
MIPSQLKRQEKRGPGFRSREFSVTGKDNDLSSLIILRDVALPRENAVMYRAMQHQVLGCTANLCLVSINTPYWTSGHTKLVRRK